MISHVHVGVDDLERAVAFLSAAVDRCHAAALAHGGSSEGAPSLHPHYHANKLCVCCHQPEPT